MSNTKYPWTTEHQIKAFNEDGSVIGWVVDAGDVRGLEDQLYAAQSEAQTTQTTLYTVRDELQNTKAELIQANEEIARLKGGAT